MKNIKTFFAKFGFLSYVATLAFVFSLFAFGPMLSVQIARAMPDTFCITGQSTSTPVYLSLGGTSTTTVYASAGCSNQLYGAKVYSMLANFTASSTVTTFQITQEFANGNSVGTDCIATPTACEWYQATYTSISGFATTSPMSAVLDIADVPTLQYKFASSTIAGNSSTVGLKGPAGTNNRNTKLIQFPALTRYSRWIITISPVANGNGAFSADIVGKKEIGEK